MIAAPVHVARERLMLDPTGGLYWPAMHLLAVSDLHLEKASSYARRGQFLPPWDTRATLDRLALLLRRYRPRSVVAFGGSFHDAEGVSRLPASELARLHAMTTAHCFIWVQGNHDPSPPQGLLGDWTDVFATTTLVFRHQAAQTAQGEISGHHHPKATVPARGGIVSRPCFVADCHRLMMPALGAYAGGLNVRDPAIGGLFPRGGRVFLLGKERWFSFALGTLRTG
jgi:DNA ligase-associated metallophosphoesterase